MSEQAKVQCPAVAPISMASADDNFCWRQAARRCRWPALRLVPKAAAQQAGSATPAAERTARPAESLIRELYSTLSEQRRGRVVMAWDHGTGRNSVATRLKMYNASLNQHTIGAVYTNAQKELNQRNSPRRLLR